LFIEENNMTKKPTKIVHIEGDVTPKFKSAFAAALAQVVLTGKMPPRAKRKIVMRNGKAVIVPNKGKRK
jgi:hypothetical protein